MLTKTFGQYGLTINNDGDFADANEQVYTLNNASNTAVSATVAFPENVQVSNTTMRVLLHANSVSNDACDYSSYGDYRDYIINVGREDGTGTNPDYALVQQPRGGEGEHIASVMIGGDLYSTGNDRGYGDYATRKTFAVSDGESVALTPVTSWGTDWGIWIDSDNNGSFESNERVFSGSGISDQVVKGTLDLSRIRSGTSRMRIAMNGDGSPVATGFTFGEIEDYTVDVNGDDSGGEDVLYGADYKWQHDSVHVVVLRYEFNDVALDYSSRRVQEEMEEVKAYFANETFGGFDVTYEIRNEILDVNQEKSYYDILPSWDWNDFLYAEAAKLGYDVYNVKDNIVYLNIAPSLLRYDEDDDLWEPRGPVASPNPGFIKLWDDGDDRTKAGGIAHEMGHAMGLHHAKAINAEDDVLGTGDLDDEAITYGNYFSLMGNSAWTFGGLTLYYKSFFDTLNIEQNVPLITQSGTYRIYAHDQGTISGDIGLRLQAGNNESTYWIEYRTREEEGIQTDGVYINIVEYEPDYKHNVKDYYFDTSYLLDMTPNSILEQRGDDWPGYDLLDSALVIGESFSDKWGNFTITTKRKGGTIGTANAWIEVEVTMH